jgi:hypothetical protein
MDAAFGVVVEEGGGHLAAAGVVDTDEQDLGRVGHGDSLGVGGRGHPSTALTAVDTADILSHRQ